MQQCVNNGMHDIAVSMVMHLIAQ